MKTGSNAYIKSTYDFIGDILVECPMCSCKATVISTGDLQRSDFDTETKVTCSQCGYNKLLAEKPKEVLYFSRRPLEVRYYYMNTAIDPYFQLPLWLKAKFREELFWAYNYQHLDLLETHIAADLRERSLEGISNRSIGSRLPRWMSSAKNRTELLRLIAKLRQK